MTPELQEVLTNIGFGILVVAIIALLFWILTYDSFHNGGLQLGDKFVDKRWKETQLQVLGFAHDGSGWIRVKKTFKDGTEVITDVSLETIYDNYERIEEVNTEVAE